MKIKTNALSGVALDWAVAKCEDISRLDERVTPEGVRWAGDFFQPSKHWSEGGPIIEREHIALDYYHTPVHPDVQPRWEARHGSGVFEYGPTPLIAAMRCYVASKFGDEVAVPDELLP